jgi:adenosine kinase
VRAALICGSLAFDTIMVFQDRFKNHILPDKMHMLNVSFLVPELRREFGGCAGNIAYNLKLLGGEPLIMATVGTTSGPTPSGWTLRPSTRDHPPPGGAAPTPRRPSSPPTSTTTRSPPSIPAR